MTLSRAFAWVLAAGCSGAGPAPVANRAEPRPPPPARTIESASGAAFRQVARTEHGGVLQLDGDRAAAVSAATASMDAHCGSGRYTITQEGEEPDGLGTAWRVHYQCNRSP